MTIVVTLPELIGICLLAVCGIGLFIVWVWSKFKKKKPLPDWKKRGN